MADGDQMAAGIARAGPEVHDEVGAANGLFVVLDDEHGVAEIAQLFERGEQAIVVARVQADGRLVQHVEHAAQARADLRGQANALRFAAGERGGRAVQAQIAEAHREQKIEALGNFRERRPATVALAQRQSIANAIDGGTRLADCQRGEIGDGETADFHGEALRTQAPAAANRAGRGGHVLREPFAIAVGIGFVEIAVRESRKRPGNRNPGAFLPSRVLGAGGFRWLASILAIGGNGPEQADCRRGSGSARAAEISRTASRDRIHAPSRASSSVRFK